MDMWQSLVAWWTALEPSEQASWVQAVGSIVAILIAIAVPFLGGLIKAWQDRKANRERMLNALVLVHDPIDALWRSLDEFYTTSDPDYDHDNPLISIGKKTPHVRGKRMSLVGAVTADYLFLNMASINMMNQKMGSQPRNVLASIEPVRGSLPKVLRVSMKYGK
jgi:hypothetical protein